MQRYGGINIFLKKQKSWFRLYYSAAYRWDSESSTFDGVNGREIQEGYLLSKWIPAIPPEHIWWFISNSQRIKRAKLSTETERRNLQKEAKRI